MEFYYRPLNILEQVIQEMLTVAASDKRIDAIELTHEEHKQFVALANQVLGFHELDQLQRGFFKGVQLKVIVETPNVLEIKDAIIDAVQPPPSDKAAQVIKAIKARAEKKSKPCT